MSDFVADMFQLTLFLFDKTDNVVVFVPTFCLVWCVAWAVVRRISSCFMR